MIQIVTGHAGSLSLALQPFDGEVFRTTLAASSGGAHRRTRERRAEHDGPVRRTCGIMGA